VTNFSSIRKKKEGMGNMKKIEFQNLGQKMKEGSFGQNMTPLSMLIGQQQKTLPCQI